MKPDSVALYRKMLTCRRVEEAIAGLWYEGRISGEMHLGIGEEGINAGVLDHLGDGDAVALDHRGTAGMVLRGVDPAAIVKECMGSVDGLCCGNGGHMHLFSKQHLAASSGIVGAAGPAACGFALAAQQLRPGTVAVAFFGEGAMNQGMLMEAMNLATAWDLPVLFVCRDNGMAITTASASVTGGDLQMRARGLGVSGRSVDGADAEMVWRVAGELIDRARRGRGPAFLRATCTRPEGHFLGDPLVRMARSPLAQLKPRLGPLVAAARSAEGAPMAQRVASLGKITSMLGRAVRTELGPAHDPVRRLRKRLTITSEALVKLEHEVEGIVKDAVDKALTSETANEKESSRCGK
ncbi:putative TPP-dependent acetoin dehydrogenase complex, E1 component, alpha subunit [delta proteobacterium NaphS2]|nr:putative TPP-dependent acetoin dehydrogenase complex, E1 component, alpha subunit [delta proteobacterium NaphS2]